MMTADIEPQRIIIRHTTWTCELLSKMSELQSTGMLCDTTLECCDGVSIRAHSCVLAAASNRVRSLLAGAAQGFYTLHMRDVNSSTWKNLLHFVYDGCVTLEADELETVYEAAARFQIVRLTEALDECGSIVFRKNRTRVRIHKRPGTSQADSGDVIEICDEDESSGDEAVVSHVSAATAAAAAAAVASSNTCSADKSDNTGRLQPTSNSGRVDDSNLFDKFHDGATSTNTSAASQLIGMVTSNTVLSPPSEVPAASTNRIISVPTSNAVIVLDDEDGSCQSQQVQSVIGSNVPFSDHHRSAESVANERRHHHQLTSNAPTASSVATELGQSQLASIAVMSNTNGSINGVNRLSNISKGPVSSDALNKIAGQRSTTDAPLPSNPVNAASHTVSVQSLRDDSAVGQQRIHCSSADKQQEIASSVHDVMEQNQSSSKTTSVVRGGTAGGKPRGRLRGGVSQGEKLPASSNLGHNIDDDEMLLDSITVSKTRGIRGKSRGRKAVEPAGVAGLMRGNSIESAAEPATKEITSSNRGRGSRGRRGGGRARSAATAAGKDHQSYSDEADKSVSDMETVAVSCQSSGTNNELLSGGLYSVSGDYAQRSSCVVESSDLEGNGCGQLVSSPMSSSYKALTGASTRVAAEFNAHRPTHTSCAAGTQRMPVSSSAATVATQPGLLLQGKRADAAAAAAVRVPLSPTKPRGVASIVHQTRGSRSALQPVSSLKVPTNDTNGAPTQQSVVVRDSPSQRVSSEKAVKTLPSKKSRRSDQRTGDDDTQGYHVTADGALDDIGALLLSAALPVSEASSQAASVSDSFSRGGRRKRSKKDSTPPKRSKAKQPKKSVVQFVGHRIKHEWIVKPGVRKWFTGKVLKLVSGVDGMPKCRYVVQYDEEPDPYAIDHLVEDFMEGSVIIL